MKLYVIPLLLLVLFPFTAYSQQTADVQKWFEEYESRVKNVVAARQNQRPNFVKDVQFSNPDYIVYIPKVEPEKLGDTYDDHFQVFDNAKGTLFAIWCQATVEGGLDQHVAFTRSRDKGKTWDPPKVLAGNKTIAQGLANGGQIASWATPLVSKSGRIYVLYNQFVPGKVSTNRQHTGKMMGIYSDDDGDTWTKPVEIPIPRTINDPDDTTIPPEWVIWQRPLRLGKDGHYIVGVSRHVAPKRHHLHRIVTQFIHFDNIDDDPEIKDLVVRWILGDKPLHRGPVCEEASIVILPDGRLFAVMRTGIGSPCWTVSNDRGETWSDAEPLLTKDGGTPIVHPISPCPIYDWKGNEAASGTYFLMAHNNPGYHRGPLYLIPGYFQKDARQPVWFDGPKRFIDRPYGNSFYTSTTKVDGKTVLWYPDQKFYLLGRKIEENFFDGKADVRFYVRGGAELDFWNLEEHKDGKPFKSGPAPKLQLKKGNQIASYTKGTKVFTNRDFALIQAPKCLEGKKFVRSTIEAVEVTCQTQGMLYVVTPMKDRNADSQISALKKMGFEKVSQKETLLYEHLPQGLVTLYQKEVKPGEKIALEKWSVIVNVDPSSTIAK